MFFTYLRRELTGRRKQTIVVAVGMAVAIALVIVVNAFSAGVRDAQSSVLSSVYGVGTDITVTQNAEPGSRGENGGPGQFDFGAQDGQTTSDGTRTISQDRLSTGPGTQSFDAATLTTVQKVDHVEAASATLTLTDTNFSGQMPTRQDGSDQQGGPGDGTMASAPPAGGPDGAGGSAFQVDSFTVTGVDPSADAVGPLTTVTVSDGRGLKASDEGAGSADPAKVAVLDSAYASSASKGVGDTITVAGTDLTVVGIVTSTDGDDVATSSDVYVPLGLAQSLAGLDGQVTDVYVRADSSDDVDAVAAAISKAVPDATVSTQSDLASSVSGSLSTAADLVSTWGTWLSIIVLVAAFGLAILFTVSGVTRRTRELGTLKALGWPRRRVVGQVAGESLAQGLVGGVLGVALGAVAVLGLNLAGITLSGSSGTSFAGPGGGMGGGAMPGAAPSGGPGGGGPFGQIADTASAAVDVVVHAPWSVSVAVAAIGLALLGGLLAGVVGGRRAARLRPAEALRSNS